MKLGPAYVELLERLVVAIERIADGCVPRPRESTFAPKLSPVAGYELCKCTHLQMFHAAGQGPCQRCLGELACQRFRGTGRFEAPVDKPPSAVVTARQSRPSNGAWKATPCGRAILRALALRAPRETTPKKLAVWTGYRMSGGFRNELSALRSHGLASGRKEMSITPEGHAVIGQVALPRGDALLEHWKDRLSPCAQSILEVLRRDHPKGHSNAELAEECHYRLSGGFRNELSLLRTLELIEGYDEIRAAESLTE